MAMVTLQAVQAPPRRAFITRTASASRSVMVAPQRVLGSRGSQDVDRTVPDGSGTPFPVEGRHLHPDRFTRTCRAEVARCRKALGEDALPVIRRHDLRHSLTVAGLAVIG